MAKRRLAVAIVATLALAPIVPRPAAAQGSIDLNSSMSVQCAVLNCSVLQFALTVPNQGAYTNMLVDKIDLFSNSASLFQFGSIAKIWNGSTTLYQAGATSNLWYASISATGLQANGGSAYDAANPIYLLVNMATANSGALFDGNLTYTANGYVNGTAASSNLFSTSGTVTPEPASLLLLATGLSGMAGFVRRRRRTNTAV